MRNKVTVRFNDDRAMEIENTVICEIPGACPNVFQIGYKRNDHVFVDYIPLSAVRCLTFEEVEDE